MVKIPISKPYFDEEDKNIIKKPLESGWVVQGPFVGEFEERFASFTKASFAIATSNCTTALHLGLIALGVGRGDKVIVPSFTYIASANAIEYVGAVPIFCDIDLESFNINLESLREILDKQSKIKAIMPVNLFGLCANMESIIEIAKKYNVKVIEDSACGFDSWIGSKHSGTFGDCGCFSFHPRKSLTTGEGGMLITNNSEIAQKVKSLRDHGASKTDFQRHSGQDTFLLPSFKMLGYNYRLTDIQGALGVSQIKKAEKIMDNRRKIAQKYDRALKDISQFVLPRAQEGFKHGYQSYVCLFGGEEVLKMDSIEKVDAMHIKRNLFMQKLEALGISTRQGTHAVHTLEYYKNKYNLQRQDYFKSYVADRLSISLPLYPQMTMQEFEYIIDSIYKVL